MIGQEINDIINHFDTIPERDGKTKVLYQCRASEGSMMFFISSLRLYLAGFME